MAGRRRSKKAHAQHRFQTMVADLMAQGHSEASARAIAADHCFKRYGKAACERAAKLHRAVHG